MRKLLLYSLAVLILAVGYYVYIVSARPPTREQETFLSEIGEGVGELAMWAFIAIYFRTVVKLALGKGPMARRLLPDYAAPKGGLLVERLIGMLDRTHVFLGIAAVALTLLHIALMGLHAEIWFFPAVLVLVLWQMSFGLFLSWRGTPRDLKRWSYMVHAQLITGVAIGVFAFFGHLLVDA